MNNQNRILRQRQFEDTGDDVISFHEDEEEHNYLGKKELMEIEGDKSIDPDFSYDDDKSKLSTIKKNTNTELMKLLTDSTTELYQRKSGTNNLIGSIDNDFSKDLSRDNELNNLLNSKTFNAPLTKSGNTIITTMNQYQNQNPKYSNILQQIPTKIDNNFYYGSNYNSNNNFNNNNFHNNNFNNNNFNNNNKSNNNKNNILSNQSINFMNSNNSTSNNLNNIKKYNNNNKLYQINSFHYYIQGKNYQSFNQRDPSFGFGQSLDLEKNYKELEKSYNEVLGLIQYWQKFYLDIANLVSENININKDDPFSDDFKFAVIDNVKTIVKLAKEKAFSIFEICNVENINIINKNKKRKKNDFIPFHNLKFEILGYEKDNILLMYSKENDFMIQKTVKLNEENIHKGFKRKKYYKVDDSLDSLPPVIYRKYMTEGTNTDKIILNDIQIQTDKNYIEKEIIEKPIIKEVIKEKIIEIQNKIFIKEKLKIIKINSFLIKKDIKKNSIINKQIQNSTPKNSSRPKTPTKMKVILRVVSIQENKINILGKPKKEKVKIFKIQNTQSDLKYTDIERIELLNRELSLQISEAENEKRELKKNLEEKKKLILEKEKLKEKNINTEQNNMLNTNTSNNLLNNSFLFLPEMIPPEQTYKIFIHCIKHFKYEEENYKRYMEEEDLQNLKVFVNKMEKYLIGTSYPVQRKPQDTIHYYKPVESTTQKKYKESILTGIKPMTLSKSRTNSKSKNIDYRSYSTVNNNSTFNKYKAVIKALKNN